MPDAFDALEAQLQNRPVTITGRGGRDAFDVLQSELEQPYSGGAAFSGGFVRDIPIVGPSIESGAQAAAAGIRSGMYGTPYEQERQTVGEFARRATAANPALAAAGGLAGATTAMAPLGATALGARALGAVGNIPTRIGASTLTNTAIGAADAAARGLDPETGAVAGGIMGAVAPGVAGLTRGLLSPFANRPAAREPALDVLRRADVPLTAGDITGSRTLRSAENVLRDYPFIGPRTRDIKDVQDLGYTSAVLREAGFPVPREGTLVRPSTPGQPGTLEEQRQALNNTFNAISARTTLNTGSTPFVNDINAVEREYGRLLPTEQRNMFHSIMADLRGAGQGISGRQYQDIRTFLRREADAHRNARDGSDTNTSLAFRRLGEALDNEMTRSVPPADAQAWRDAQRLWGNMRTLEATMAGGSERTSQGYIDPARLQSTISGRDKSRYARGQGDLTEIAQAGTSILRPLPESGTGRQVLGQHLIGSVVGGAVGGAQGQDYGSALTGAIAGGIAGPYAFGRVLQSPIIQRYLANQAVTTPGVLRALGGTFQEGRRTLGELGD